MWTGRISRSCSRLIARWMGCKSWLWGLKCAFGDRFMKAHGFELFNLSLRRYSTAALPSQFVGRAPGATERGRVHHGDAMYARDLAGGLYDEFAKTLTGEKLLNLAAIFAIFNLPDCAAELITKYRAELAGLGDVDRMLDRLTA